MLQYPLCQVSTSDNKEKRKDTFSKACASQKNYNILKC